jgi:hypothetical protein
VFRKRDLVLLAGALWLVVPDGRVAGGELLAGTEAGER